MSSLALQVTPEPRCEPSLAFPFYFALIKDVEEQDILGQTKCFSILRQFIFLLAEEKR